MNWNELDPDKKRNLILAGIVLVILIGFWALSGSTDDGSTSESSAKQQNITRVLGNRDTREFGVQELQSTVKSLQRDKKEMERKQERMTTELYELKRRKGDETILTNQVENVQASLQALKDELQNVKETNKDLRRDVVEAKTQASRAVERVGTGTAKVSKNDLDRDSGQALNAANNSELMKDPNAFFASAALPEKKEDDPKGKSRNKDGESAAQIRVIGVPDVAETNEDADRDEGVYIPAGSMITGVLINGLDAPTSTDASRNPFPATMRIQHEALLPNYFTADVRECFLIISGHGDLSSERAYLRGEDISCINDDGDVIESGIKGYATGEDGKAGIRGRLVSKSGQIIGRALQAGFLEGLAGALDYTPVPVIQTSGITGTPQFQNALSSETLANGALGGAGSALERIADYYLQMAENIFPVIEIDAGREVTFILTKGVQLKPKNRGTVAKYKINRKGY